MHERQPPCSAAAATAPAWLHSTARLTCGAPHTSAVVSAAAAIVCRFQIWPYMKPLRKWIRRQQYNHPSWDMPVTSTTPEQPQQAWPSRNGNGSTNGSSTAISMHTPYYPQQMQDLQGSLQSEQQAGSPQHKKLDEQQGQLTPSSSTPVQQQQGSSTGAAVGRTCGRAAGSSSGSLCGPLASLFGAAAAAADCPKDFTFDKQAILRALIEPAAAAHCRMMVAGR